MTHSRRRQKAEGRRERLTNSITIFGVQDVESTNVMSNQFNQTGEGVHPSLTSTDSEMLIADGIDKDCDSDTSTSTNPSIQRSRNANSEKGLGGVDPFIERNQDIMASTLEWRGRVLRSQEATQATTSSRQPHTAKERRYALSEEIEIEQIEENYREQEEILDKEITKHKERHKQAIEQLKAEEEYKEGYGYAADWWGVRPGSDYQPTECGD